MSSFIPSTSSIPFNRYRSVEYRKSLISDLLICIKDCQSTYGNKRSLATEDDPRVSKLCDCWELILCHGLVETNVASVLKNVTEMVTSAPVELPNFWEFAYIHLANNERERFSSLKHVFTDRGRTRSLIRATLNEHSLDRYICVWLNDPDLDKSYEPWAIMRDQEASAMLSSMASGLNSVLFALSIDNQKLNAVRPIKDLSKPEPIIAAPSPPVGNNSAAAGIKKKTRQIIMDDDDEEEDSINKSPTSENLSTQCLIKEPEVSPVDVVVTPSQVFNVPEELPSEIQSILCRSAPSSMTNSRMSISSERSVRTELFPEPPTSSSFIYPAVLEDTDGVNDLSRNDDGERDRDGEGESDEKERNLSVPSEEDGSSVHSSAVSSVDVDVEKLRSRLEETEQRCQYLEARVAQLSLENHRLKGLTNTPRGRANCFTVTVPRVHLDKNNKYFVYEIQIVPNSGGDEWTTRKRYRDFYELHQAYQKTNPAVKALDFPPKKKFGNMDACFVEQRRQRLQVYLRHMMAILPEVATCNTRAELEDVFPFLR